MTKQILIVMYIVILIVLIVGIDILFFKDRFWARLLANTGIVFICDF